MWKFVKSLFVTSSQYDQLIDLLNQAKKEAINRNLELTAYSDANDFVKFLDECIQNMKTNNNLSFYQHLELVGIFFPTGEWDDAHGSQELANQITDVIDNLEKYQFCKNVYSWVNY